MLIPENHCSNDAQIKKKELKIISVLDLVGMILWRNTKFVTKIQDFIVHITWNINCCGYQVLVSSVWDSNHFKLQAQFPTFPLFIKGMQQQSVGSHVNTLITLNRWEWLLNTKYWNSPSCQGNSSQSRGPLANQALLGLWQTQIVTTATSSIWKSPSSTGMIQWQQHNPEQPLPSPCLWPGSSTQWGRQRGLYQGHACCLCSTTESSTPDRTRVQAGDCPRASVGKDGDRKNLQI